MQDCLFCKIIAGEIPSTKVYEDETVYAFRDIEPQAPEHILVIPKKHIKSILELGKEDAELIAHMFEVAKLITQELGIAEAGFRTVFNTGENGQQSVPHLHMHILGGRMLQWPPG